MVYIASAGQGIAHADNMAPILAACAGSWYEGPEGEYPIAGANQAVIATITDGDLLVEEDDRISLKRTRSELVNTIAGTYASPDAFYDGLPLATRTDASAFAADRECLAASIPYEAVVDPKVGDRLNDIALRASRYQANAEICLRPKFLGLKVGQWIRWQSDKADGFDKTFQIVGRRLGPIGPKACRTVYVKLQEVGEGISDPTAYSTLPPDATGVGAPDYQSELVNFAVSGIVLTASTGSERAGIRATWNALEDITITFIDLEYEPIAAAGEVPSATAKQSAKANQTKEDLFQGVLSSSLWAVRYTLRSSPPRTFFPSAWFEVDTLKAQLGADDVYLDGMVDEINEHVLENLAPLNVSIRDQIETARQIAASAMNQDAGQYLDQQRSLTQVKSVYENITADYQLLITAATGPGSAIVQRLETLEVALPGKASVSALNSIGLVATDTGGNITGVGTAISGIMAQVNASLASGMFRTYVEATETGALATIGISAAASSGGATSQAAILVSALANGTSMIGLLADLVYMTDGAGNKQYPFVFSGGILRANQMRIGFAQINDVAIDFADITNVHVTGDMIVDGSIDSPSLALKAVTDSKSSSLPSTALNYSGAPTNVWVDILTVTVANMVTNPIMVSLYLSMGVNNSTLTVRLVRRVGAGDTVLNAYTQTLSSGGGASKIYGPAVSFDAGAPSGSVTYVIQYNYSPGSGGGTAAALAAEITAMIFKR